MKKKIAALVASCALALAGCGDADVIMEAVGELESVLEEAIPGEESEEEANEESEETTVPAAEIDPAGTYKNVSMMFDAVYILNDNGTYDKTSPEEKGTYTVEENGDLKLKENNSSAITYIAHGSYYYRGDRKIASDEEYGAAVSFDENGRSSQTFETTFISQDNGQSIGYELTLREDGTFLLQEEVGHMDGGIMIVQDGDSFEGTYAQQGDVLTLIWQETDYEILYLEGNLYYDVIEKETDKNAQELEARLAALEAAENAKYELVDEALAAEIRGKLQGVWEYSEGAVSYSIQFDGDHISVSSSVGGYGLSNQGTYEICRDLLLITYDSGGQATMDYTYENGELTIQRLVGLTD